MTVLMKSIILSMDRSYQELSKTPIGFLLTTITSRESDVGGVGSGTGGIVVGIGVGERVVVVLLFLLCVVEVLLGRLLCCCFIVDDWVLLWYYQK
jgi:hypothetical protein